MSAPTNPATSAGDSANPGLWDSLTVAYLASENSWLLHNQTPNYGTDASLATDATYGQVLSWDTTNNNAGIAIPFEFDPTQPFTLLTFVKEQSTLSDDNFYFVLGSSSGYVYFKHRAYNANNYYNILWKDSTGAYEQKQDVTWSSSGWTPLAFVWDGSALAVYDGTTQKDSAASTALMQSALADAAGGNLIIGGMQGISAHSATEYDQAVAYAWGRALSTSELGTLADDPFAPLRPSGPDLSIDGRQGGTIVQRDNGSAGITFTGDCDGQRAVEVSVINSSDFASVVDWQAATVSGTRYTATLSVPEGGWYAAKCRYAGDSSTQVFASGIFGVGILIGVIGQSNVEHWWYGDWTPTSPTTGTEQVPGNMIRTFKNGTWSEFVSGSDGAIAYANELHDNLASPVPVGLINGPVGGSALLAAARSSYNTALKGYWLDTATDGDYGRFISDVNATGGSLEQIVWQQGERDAKSVAEGSGITQQDYRDGLGTLFSRLRTDCANASNQANLPIMVGPIGKGTPTDYDVTAYSMIRQAQQQAVAEIADLTLGANKIDLATLADDNPHLTRASYILMGQRYARVSLAMLGEASGYGNPVISDITRSSDTQTSVAIDHGGGTDFTPTTGIEGFQVNGVAVTADRDSATSIVLTHAAVTGDRTVSYEYRETYQTPTAPFADNAPVSFDLLFYRHTLAASGTATYPAKSASESQNPGLWDSAAFFYAGVPDSDWFGLTSIASSSGITSGSTQYGPAGVYDGSAYAALGSDPMAGASAGTLLAVIQPSVLDGNNSVLENGTDRFSHWAVWPDSQGTAGGETDCVSFDVGVFDSAASVRVESAANSISAGTAYVVAIRTSTASAPQIWINGTDRTNYRGASLGQAFATNGPLRIGNGGLGGFKGAVSAVGGWTRRFSDTEMAQISADPYAAFRVAAESGSVNVAIQPGRYTLAGAALMGQAGAVAQLSANTAQASGQTLNAAAGVSTAMQPPLLQLRQQAVLAQAGTNVPVSAAVTAGRYASAGQTMTAQAGANTAVQPGRNQLSTIALQLRAGANVNVDAQTLSLLPQALTAVAGSNIPVQVAIGSAKATLTGQAPEVIAGQLVAIAPSAHVNTAQMATAHAGVNAEIEAQALTLQAMRFDVALNATGYLVADGFTITPILSADGFEIKPN